MIVHSMSKRGMPIRAPDPPVVTADSFAALFLSFDARQTQGRSPWDLKLLPGRHSVRKNYHQLSIWMPHVRPLVSLA